MHLIEILDALLTFCSLTCTAVAKLAPSLPSALAATATSAVMAVLYAEVPKTVTVSDVALSVGVVKFIASVALTVDAVMAIRFYSNTGLGRDEAVLAPVEFKVAVVLAVTGALDLEMWSTGAEVVPW